MQIPSRKIITCLNDISVDCLFNYHFDPNDLQKCGVIKLRPFEFSAEKVFTENIYLIHYGHKIRGDSIEAIKTENYVRARNNTQRKWVVFWFYLYNQYIKKIRNNFNLYNLANVEKSIYQFIKKQQLL